MKCLILIPTDGHGGCEYNALTFGMYLKEVRKLDVYVSFPINSGTSYIAYLAVLNGLKLVPFQVRFPSSDNEERVAIQERETWRVLEQIRPDFVFIPSPWPKRGQGMILGCMGVGVPTLVKVALVPEEWGTGYVHPALREAQASRQLWFANSAYSAALLEKHYGLPPGTVDYFHVGPIGVHTLTLGWVAARRSRGVQQKSRGEVLGFDADGKFIITTVSRLAKQKGYYTLAEAVPEVLRRAPQAHFVWVGDGEERENLTRLLDSKGVLGAVTMLGYRSDVRDVLRCSDAFVLPTEYEGGCSQVLLEAMEEGVPVVATRASAVEDIIRHGENGLLAKTRDPLDLAEKTEALAQSDALRAKLAKCATETVKTYSADVMFENTFERIERLLRRRIESVPEPAPVDWEAAFTLDDEEALVSLDSPAFSYGWVDVEPGTGGAQRWAKRFSAVHVPSTIAKRSKSVFLAGRNRVSDDAVQGARFTINGIPVDAAISLAESGPSWKASVSIPRGIDRDRGILIQIEAGDEKELGGLFSSRYAGVHAALAVRKLALRLSR